MSALRELRGGKVAVELDGARWRTMPADVVVRSRLRVGEELERTRLRELARELRRARAVDTALRAVARREQSAAELDRRLERRGVTPGLREETVGRLEAVGLVDDERFARRLAESLAERGHGDQAIRWRLERDGVAAETAAAALGALAPELERARLIVAARGAGPRTARELARRGFGEEAVEAALGPVIADAP
ncbi:MAG TPA: RecX family transcriptional regulator [Gaiellaceae bacterium]|nr:RecX family transcriptional regulator [Gaiellaceae bacterium]